MECQICIEKFNNSRRKRIICNKCKYEICTTCIKRFLLTTETPKCMNCNNEFSAEFINEKMSNKFYNKDLRDALARKFLDKEKSKLPDTMFKIQERKENMIKIKEINKQIESLILQRN